jgi:hypothetical protein
LDETGIQKRTLTGWESWPWEAFASGKIARGVSPDYYVDQSNSRARRLTLSFLSKEDQEYVHRRIREVWRPAAAPALPGSLWVRFGNWSRGRCRAEFSDEGICLERRRTRNRFLYGWADVREVLIRRTSHEHRGFRSLEIAFADGERIQLGVENNLKRQWSGPDPETVAGYVQAHVDADRIVSRANIGPARSLEEAHYRIDMANRDAQRMKWRGRGALAVAVLVSGAYFSTGAMKHGWNPLQWDGVMQLACVVLMLCINMMGFMFWAVLRSLRGDMERGQQALIKTLDELRRQGSVA